MTKEELLKYNKRGYFVILSNWDTFVIFRNTISREDLEYADSNKAVLVNPNMNKDLFRIELESLRNRIDKGEDINKIEVDYTSLLKKYVENDIALDISDIVIEDFSSYKMAVKASDGSEVVFAIEKVYVFSK